MSLLADDLERVPPEFPPEFEGPSSGWIPFSVLTLLLFTFAILLLYFVPSYIARTRQHFFWPQILILNILTGWTVLGWIAALAWALTPPERPSTLRKL
ncbi:MAG: superinfection immunity protein [Planctomycetaceae bacterium]|nr:superinfection immunity protein [Planctomycetaceae bacterium]MCB9950613.1 superinfection immunity protein [Planctomycetaceae bacterium]